MTTIKVPKAVRDRVSRLAQQHRMTQHAYLDQLLREAEEKEFWRRMTAIGGPAEYRRILTEDGDLPDEDFSVEEDAILAEERRRPKDA